MTDAWTTLNNRQRTYLTLIYEEDQAQERAERQRAALDHSSRLAEEWRWILYANEVRGYTPLKQELKAAGLVDPGTGSTFEALEKRGYILTRSEGATPHHRSELIVHVRLTTKGRKLVRQALNLPSSSRMKVGMLQEWHWRALAKAYEAGERGVPEEGIGYGRIGWNTWLRLRDYKIHGNDYPLIRQYKGISITTWGVGYYERTFARYQTVYPGVAAPAPVEPPHPLEPFIEIVQGHRTCRACRGEHLVAVTRTYRQNPAQVWSVEEQECRILGIVTSPYGDVEQCACQEEDIQEASPSFLDLLDQWIVNGWQVSFTGLHWHSSLDYVMGGSGGGHSRTFYDPVLVKQKLLPLIHDPGYDDVLKGDVRYCYNVRVGKGSMYPSSPLGPLRWPLAVAQRDARKA